MVCKVLEIRDRGTFIPALALRLDPANEQERRLMSRAGYGLTVEAQREYILLLRLEDAPYDPFEHGGGTTLRDAHLYLNKHFDEVENGQVICTEYLRGERSEPKESEVA